MKASAKKKVVTYVRLSPEAIKQIDQIAGREELDRSAVIRRLVSKGLRDEPTLNKVVSRKTVEG